MKRGIILIAVILAGLSLAAAAIPQTISVHGRLTDSSGNSLSGTYSMVFSIYNAYTGGTPVYQSSQSVTVNSGGTYDAYLAVSNITFNQSYYLGIKIGSETGRENIFYGCREESRRQCQGGC